MEQISAMGIVAIEGKMRNPQSFQLISAHLTSDNFGCYQYRAQNGFGGMNVERAIQVGQVFVYEQEKEFESIWASHCAGDQGEDITKKLTYVIHYMQEHEKNK